MYIPDYTAKELAHQLCDSLEKRTGAKINARVKGMLICQIKGIVSGLKLEKGQLTHEGMLRAFANMKAQIGETVPLEQTTSQTKGRKRWKALV